MNHAQAFQIPAGVKLLGTGMAVPRTVTTNFDLEKRMDTSDEWIVQRTGIKQRYICAEDEKCSDLATAATKQAIENSNIDPSTLDLVIVATMTPDMVSPTVACQVVANLDLVPCGAIEINLACSGFVTGLNMAYNYLRSGAYKNVAVVGSESMTRILNWDDRRAAILFGDGAGAALLTASDDESQGCIFQKVHSDGTKASELYVPRHESDVTDPQLYNGKPGTIQMNGREVFKFAVTTLERAIGEAMEACALSPADIDLVVPHQSNVRIIDSARQRIGFSEEQVYINLDRFGNTSAASVGICLHELTEKNRLSKGDTVVFAGVGAGLTWATSVWKL